MVRPDEDMHLDLCSVKIEGCTVAKSMAKFTWKGEDVTMYRDGSLIF